MKITHKYIYIYISLFSAYVSIIYYVSHNVHIIKRNKKHNMNSNNDKS